MKRILIIVSCLLCVIACSEKRSSKETDEVLAKHNIRVDKNGNIVPWNNDAVDLAYDDIIDRLWSYWEQAPRGYDGTPVYMTQLLLNSQYDHGRGIAGDQFAMVLSSWNLLYNYLGEEDININMEFIADHYLQYGLSPADCAWPNLPFPQNTISKTSVYDGDMMLGKGYLQPDKAASFAYELLKFALSYQSTMKKDAYIQAVIKIADCLAERCTAGDAEHSPWPFKVHAFTGEIPVGPFTFACRDKVEYDEIPQFTTNYTSALELFNALCDLGYGNTALYKATFDKVLNWMKKYPLQNNRWGVFFEDVGGWSDTQTNAVTFAQFIMNHPDLFEDWKADVNSIFDWVYSILGNKTWEKYGVTAINEQTCYMVPGNSHTSRQACAELQYVHMSGDSTRYEGAVRQLSWATYMVDEDGDNCYGPDPESKSDWISDGYGDYVRHYLRAMHYCPELAPHNENHIIYSDCPLARIRYGENNNILKFRTCGAGDIHIRLCSEPSSVLIELKRQEVGSWDWNPMPQGGGLLIIHNPDWTTITIK